MPIGGSQSIVLPDGSTAERVVVVDGTTGTPQTSGGAVTIADAADVTQGAVADAVVAAGAAGSISAKLRAISRDLVANIVLAAGSAIIGKVGIDQTTPGTTNKVVATPVGTDATATGTLGALNAAVTIDTKGMATVVFEVDAGLAAAGVVSYEATLDDATWFAISGIPALNTSIVALSDTTSVLPVRRLFGVAGYSQARARVSTYVSGSSVARARASVLSLRSSLVSVGPNFTSTDADSNALGLVADAAGAGRKLAVAPFLFNGTNWDRQYNNREATALASAARTTQTASADLNAFNARVLVAILDITVASGAGGLILRWQYKDPISGNYISMNSAPTGLITTGTRAYAIMATVSVATHTFQQIASVPVPRTYRILMEVGDASSYTYSVAVLSLV